jgi:hypothetical protein
VAERTIEEMAAEYLRLRNEIEEMEARHDEEIAELKLAFRNVGEDLLGVCNEQNLDSVRTPAGTVSRRVSSRYWSSDWESMYKFIKQNDAHFLLEQRINNGNMRQFLEENPDKAPVGLQSDSKYTVSVRKPTAK